MRGFVGTNGQLRIDARFAEVLPFKADTTAVRLAAGKWRLIDKRGRFVGAEVFDDVGPFYEGRAMVRLDDRRGFVDATGRGVVAPAFAYVGRYSDGLAQVRENADPRSGFCVINLQGQTVFCREAGWMIGRFSEGRVWASRPDRQQVLLDANGTQVAEIIHCATLGPFSEGLAVCRVIHASGRERHGYLNRSGKTVIAAEFDYASAFRDGLALVHRGGEWYAGGIGHIRTITVTHGRWMYIRKDGQSVWTAQAESGGFDGPPRHWFQRTGTGTELFTVEEVKEMLAGGMFFGEPLGTTLDRPQDKDTTKGGE